MKKTSPQKAIRPGIHPMIYPALLVFVFILSFSYIFNSKIDLNGDNCVYYQLATSIAEGHGYSDITNESCSPTNSFPPGYPLLMSSIRIFTDSFFPQKVFNGIFLLGAAFLFFFFIRKNKLPDALAFVATVLLLLNYQVLHFATMMMSEMSFLFMAALAFFFLAQMDNEKPFWKDRNFYFALLSTAYCYHIRTQGMALVVAVLGFFLFTGKWKQMFAFAGGFVLCLFPWILRNKLLDLGQSRYLDMIGVSNPWRPEEGVLSTGEVISRFFDTFRMLITKAVPNSILPYFSVDYSLSTTGIEWLIGIVLLALIVVGMWRFGKYKYLFLFYILATFGIISLFSTPSGNRYITGILPFLEICLVVGLYSLLSWMVQKLKMANHFSPWLLILLCFFSVPQLKQLHEQNKAPFPANYRNFFSIAKEVHKQLPPKTVVCSRKPSLFYMFSKSSVCNYLWTQDDRALIEGLIQSKVDYVVLEQLGYSSTSLYLYPAIQKHSELFNMVYSLGNPDTYLLKFDREKAKKKMDSLP